MSCYSRTEDVRITTETFDFCPARTHSSEDRAAAERTLESAGWEQSGRLLVAREATDFFGSSLDPRSASELDTLRVVPVVSAYRKLGTGRLHVRIRFVSFRNRAVLRAAVTIGSIRSGYNSAP
jgi:hypothetical protein